MSNDIHQVLSWGNGANGRLGLGDTRDQAIAKPITKLQEFDIIRVFCGVSHSLAVSSSGKAYSWGKNTNGQCGHDDSVLSDQVRAKTVLVGRSKKIVSESSTTLWNSRQKSACDVTRISALVWSRNSVLSIFSHQEGESQQLSVSRSHSNFPNHST